MIDKQQEINRKQLEARAKLIALSSQNYKTKLYNEKQLVRKNHSDETNIKKISFQKVQYNPKTQTSRIVNTKPIKAPYEDSVNGVDPVGEFYVSTVAANPLFKLLQLGKSAVTNLGKKYILYKTINKATQNAEPKIFIEQKFEPRTFLNLNSNMGYYFKTDNPHIIQPNGLKRLNEKPTYFFQSENPNSYYFKYQDKARSETPKVGINPQDLSVNDFLDFLLGGSQNLEGLPIYKKLNKDINRLFNSKNYQYNLHMSNFNADKFNNDFLPKMLQNSTTANISNRLTNIYGSKTSSGINTHYIKMPTVNNVLVRDMVNTPTEDVLQTYYHEVGGHGTDSFFGTTKTYDNTGLTDKFIKPINNKNQFLQYNKRPNEIRAKALSTKALFINYPKFSREYFKTSPDGRIERAFDNSQFYNLTRATGDWIDAQNYVNDVYEKGGKL